VNREDLAQANKLLAEYDRVVALARQLAVSDYVRMAIGRDMRIDSPTTIVEDVPKEVVKKWLMGRLGEIENALSNYPYNISVTRPDIGVPVAPAKED